jgi:hypothetical protein
MGYVRLPGCPGLRPERKTESPDSFPIGDEVRDRFPCLVI